MHVSAGMKKVSLLALALMFWALTTANPSAQYFGQNKVQYRQLDFKVLKTQHFDIHYYAEEQSGAELVARLAERWYVRLSRLLNHQLRGRQPLILYASPTDFQQTTVIPEPLGEGTGGVTEPLRRRIVMPLAGPLADTDHVLGHELVHAFQFDLMSSMTPGPGGAIGAERLPLWFVEGMAEYLSLGPVDSNTAMWLRDAVRQDKLPSIGDLDNPKYFPYRWGQAFWAYVGGRWGDAIVARMMHEAARGGSTDLIIQNIIGEKTKQLSDEWQASIRNTYRTVLEKTAPSGEAGRLVIKGEDFGGGLNVGPAISPNGRLIAFLSDRSFFSTDLYVADAASGRVLHKLTSTATDPHFSSLEFIYSAGAWDPESRKIAIGTVADGRPALAIFDAESGHKDREVSLAGVDEILNPTWAPDGHAICFTGMNGGLTDLYLYDLRASALLRLTNDAFADLQPSWSPDGRLIVFATDRFSSQLNTLNMGQYRLATIEPERGRIAPVRAFSEGNHLNPQWSPDGQSIYFISDRDGIANVYRVSIASGAVGQLTDVGTGVSGITHSSAALSVAAASGTAAFSVYENSRYDIYTLDADTNGRAPDDASSSAAVLPPRDRRASDVIALLNQPALGLPAANEQYPTSNYRRSLSLETVGQPSVAVGVNRFGPTIGGGVAFVFGDMLDQHQLVTGVQMNSSFGGGLSFRDLAAQVGYFNQVHRWNWGVIGGQVPYLSGGFATGVSTAPTGEPVEVDQFIIDRQTERTASAVVAYPFSRARRIEVQGGITNIAFDRTTQTSVFSLVTGQQLSDTTATVPLARSLTLANSSVALVSDTSNFGATSPVQGERFRLEAAPTFGSIDFTSVLADYRRYFMPVPFYTFAARILHYGRYGSGAQDSRLFPLYIGYPGLVRGYDVNTFSASDCTVSAVSSCLEFDRLLGSRILIGNAEFRFPLLRPFGVSQRMYGPIPVEVAFFADAGVAWNEGERPSILGGSKRAVTSVGAALRVNLLNFAVGEFDFIRPTERRGWVFQFNLIPGF